MCVVAEITHGIIEYPYYWRVRTKLPDRFGQCCAVLVRGRRNNCLVQFEDGYKVITSRNFVRRRDGKRQRN